MKYDDIDGLAKTLEAEGIDTVISALSMDGPGANSQLNLIAAADKAPTTRRFIPSDFAGHAPGT